MKVFSSLYARLAFAILILFSALGAALLYISVQSSERFALETTQPVSYTHLTLPTTPYV